MDTKTGASFRALSSPVNEVAWVAGTKGTVCKSTDGGQAFICKPVAGFDSADFRSLYAWDDTRAIIANTGSPAVVLLTTNGGNQWEEVLRFDHKDAFIDGIDFWNDAEGILYGDPIEGRLMIWTTADSGKTWKQLPKNSRPEVTEGESSFAASGTAIRCFGENRVVIATGGKVSRLLLSNDRGKTWEVSHVPVIQGGDGTGIFSVDFYDEKKGIVVGGDYKYPDQQKDHIFITLDGGKTWRPPFIPTNGYRECVSYLSLKMVMAVGPNGVDYTIDGGLNWIRFTGDKKLHAVRKARKGSRVFVCGGEGKAGYVILK
jgi:photosystem II stability/assembly factor-like uncharacterized protein